MSEKFMKGFYDRNGEKHEFSATPKVLDATAGNFVSVDAQGNLVDSEHSPASFAYHDHSHSEVRSGDCAVTADRSEAGGVVKIQANTYIRLSVFDGVEEKIAYIQANNIDRLKALLDGSIQTAISEKMSATVGAAGELLFGVENNSLVLHEDADYSDIFVNAHTIFPVMIEVFDANEDVFVPFMGFCETSNETTKLVSKLYIGSRVIVLEKVIETGVVSIESTYKLETLLGEVTQPVAAQ